MKNDQRPAGPGTSRPNETQRNPPPAPKPAPKIPEPGYNPYDTVTTRISDLGRSKPKAP